MAKTASRNSCTAVIEFKYSGASLFRRSPIETRVRVASDDDSESEPEEPVNQLLLDPTQWKEQDHYIVLGLSKLRYKASPEQIRKAYRQKVLTHHPDKLSEEQLKEGGDDYFKCIKIAYDLLADPKKRRAFDSVDPTFDDTIPSQSASGKEDFYELFGPVFARNARWSVQQPVPLLGNDYSTREEVETFYHFWYDIETWREFSYLDEEKTDKAECREERKWMEKQNKIMRQKRKKEDVARVRSLVDLAYGCDPRIKRFKEAEKAEKIAKKKAREETLKLEARERERVAREKKERERIEKELKEAEERTRAAQAKKEKDALKKAIRKERKTLKTTIKGYEYFTTEESEVVVKMQDLDRLCEHLSLDQLRSVNEQLAAATGDQAKSIFEEEVVGLTRRQAEERQASKIATSKAQAAQASGGTGSVSSWSSEEVQLLVKAVNLYPAGTVLRWETIATYLNTHSTESSKNKTSKDVIKQVKGMQKLEAADKEAQNKMAFSTFEQGQKVKGKAAAVAGAEAAPTKRYDEPQPWTAEEQKLLEKGLRAHPASLADRWDRIAETVATRSKAECVARFKELVAKVKAKKTQS